MQSPIDVGSIKTTDRGNTARAYQRRDKEREREREREGEREREREREGETAHK